MREGWEYKKLGEVCDIICGQDYKQVIAPDGLYPIYGTGGVMGYANQFRCPANSVIVGRKGSINNPLFVEENFWNVDTAFGIVPSKNSLIPKFFFYFCRDYDFTKHNVAVTIPSLRRIDLLKILVPKPPLSEQERIVSELDLLSSIIEKKKAQLKELDNLAQSIFYDMFGDPVTNEKGWEVKKLGEVGDIITGSTPSTKDSENYATSDYCFFKPSDLPTDSVGYLTKSEYHISKKGFSVSRKLPKGAILVSCIGSIGKVGILQLDATSNQQINTIIPNNDVVSVFLAFSIVSMKEVMTDKANAPVVPIINKSDFSKFNTILPPLSLQQSFAEKIEAIEHQKELIKQSITETETLFNSRMDYYFN